MPEFARGFFNFGGFRPAPAKSSTAVSSAEAKVETSAGQLDGGANGQAGATVASDDVAMGEAADTVSSHLMPPAPKEAPISKGRLKVQIFEARNLHVRSPSAAPYVVCSYDSSEFISQSGGQTAMAMQDGINIPSSGTGGGLSGKSARHRIMSSHPSAGGANPRWGLEPILFDVTPHSSNELEISVYDAKGDDAFLGHVRLQMQKNAEERWVRLEPRVDGDRVSGEIHIKVSFSTASNNHKINPNDFEVLRLVGKGTFGQVYQVRKKDTHRIYAMKVLSKKIIVQKKEVAHTIGERNILVNTASSQNSFIVGLKFSFQTPTDLYLVTDYMSGGELFWHLQKEGRFSEQRAKFYIAELIIALQHLHDNDIVYRDLKPENILLDANGHVALCDFGLSKANLKDDGKTTTFCGTTEYLAPEVLLDDKGYTKMVDFWSLGVLVFEMCCGWSPFYAEDTQQMYKNIAFGKVRFPRDALSTDGRNFVKGLLNRNPKHRLGSQNDARELRAHPFFSDINWDLLMAKRLPPPFKPQVSSDADFSNFDPEFTGASTSLMHNKMNIPGSTPLSPGMQENFNGFTYVGEEDTFKGRYGSYRPKSRVFAEKDDIDLYDDDDIKLSASYYGSKVPSHLGNSAGNTRPQHQLAVEERQPLHDEEDDDDSGRMMIDDERDFNGQEFEM